MGSYQFEGLDGAVGGGAPEKPEPFSFSVDAAQGPVRLRYFAPPEPLRAYFGSLYIFSASVAPYADVTRADVAQLRFMLEGGGAYHFSDGTGMATPDICLLGPTLGATRFILDRPAKVVGISLLPAGWIGLHGGDASDLADRLCDMTERGDAGYAALLERLRGMDDADAMAAACWAFLERRLPSLPPATWHRLDMVDAWLMGDGSPRVDVLAAMTGLSPRQLARLTNRYYGAPPKLLARKYRALRCSARIAIDRENWQTLCDDGNFYDQSHFIREIKHFIGLTPHQLSRGPSPVAQLTLLRRTLGADVAIFNRLS